MKVLGSMCDQQSSIFFSIGQKGTWEPAIGLCRSSFDETEHHEKEKKEELQQLYFPWSMNCITSCIPLKELELQLTDSFLGMQLIN